jgi:hypothetical protein
MVVVEGVVEGVRVEDQAIVPEDQDPALTAVAVAVAEVAVAEEAEEAEEAEVVAEEVAEEVVTMVAVAVDQVQRPKTAQTRTLAPRLAAICWQVCSF